MADVTGVVRRTTRTREVASVVQMVSMVRTQDLEVDRAIRDWFGRAEEEGRQDTWDGIFCAP